MNCNECIHVEMCKWIDQLGGRGCDFLDGRQEPAEYLVDCMVQYIKAHDTPSLIELVIKAIKESEE